MTAVQLFSLNVLAVVVVILAALAFWAAQKAANRREGFMFAAGLFALIGLPTIYALSVL